MVKKKAPKSKKGQSKAKTKSKAKEEIPEVKVTKVDPMHLLRLSFLEWLEKEEGIILYACAKVNISRQTYYDWRKKFAWFKAQADKIIAVQCKERDDKVEKKLFKIIDKGHPAGIIFYLKTRHPKYRPKSDVNFKGEMTVKNKLSKEEQALINKALDYGFGSNKKENSNKQKL